MNSENNNSQEISINNLLKGSAEIVDHIFLKLFQFCEFLFKRKYIILIIILIAGCLGYFLDNYNKKNKFKHEMIVVPNVRSQVFLYKHIQNLQFKPGSALISAEIEPIVNIYEFIVSYPENLKIAEFLADNNVKLVKHVKDGETEQVYKYHILTFYSNDYDRGNREIKKIMDEINSERYYVEQRNIQLDFYNNKLQENLVSIQNINNLFSRLGSNSPINTGNVNIEVFTEINKLMELKQAILSENRELNVGIKEHSKVVYDVANLLGKEQKKSSRFVIYFPILFVGLYLFYCLFIRFKSKYTKMINNSQLMND